MPRRRVRTAVEGIETRRSTVQKKVTADKLSVTEIVHKQNLAAFLRLGGYTNGEIADALGITRGTVSGWFKDKRVAKLYEDALASLSVAARQYLETLTIHAVRRLGELLDSRDPKIAIDAIREVLDRGGLPKLSRTEKKEEHVTPLGGANDGAPQVLEVRITSPEQVQRYEELVAEAEKITKAESEEGK